MKMLPVIIIGVAIGTLIALYVAAQVAQQKLAQYQATGSGSLATGLLNSALGNLKVG